MKPQGVPVLEGRDYYIAEVALPVAHALVTAHHYARGGSNTATYLHGLFAHGDALHCLGVAWWIPPTRSCAEATIPDTLRADGVTWRQVLSLSRLVLVPDLPQNAASFLIGQSMRRIQLDGAWRVLVTYADEGQGHTGAIYRATNWEYMGRTKAQRVYVDSETGRMVARKAGPHTRTHVEMLALGCVCRGSFAKHKYRMVLSAPRRTTPRQATLFAA